MVNGGAKEAFLDGIGWFLCGVVDVLSLSEPRAATGSLVRRTSSLEVR